MVHNQIAVSSELRLETVNLLSKIKVTSPGSFFIDPKYYNETVEAWASALNGLEGFLLEGFRLWVEDAPKRSGGDKPPTVADIRKYADIAKRRQESALVNLQYKDIDPESLSSCVMICREVSEEEKLRNEAGHYHKLQKLEKDMNELENQKRWNARNRTGLHFPDKDFSAVLQPEEDLPFTPSPEQMEEFEEDPDK